jgi:hypothetical protein
MQKITDLLQAKEQPTLFKPSKVKHEFEAICLEFEEALGGRDNLLESEKARIWSMPYKKWFREDKGWEALKIMSKRGIRTVGYLEGIIKKLK